jgi:four helix bundle protein
MGDEQWLMDDELKWDWHSMKYQQFEELPVWKTSIQLAVKVMRLTETGFVSKFAGFRSQIERCSVSLSNNIAEGFERGTHEELLTFIYIARGSTGELRSMLHLLRELIGTDERSDEIDELTSLSLSVTRQLNAWLGALKKTKEVGHRHQTEARREATQAQRRRDEFLQVLRKVLDESSKAPEDDDRPVSG